MSGWWDERRKQGWFHQYNQQTRVVADPDATREDKARAWAELDKMAVPLMADKSEPWLVQKKTLVGFYKAKGRRLP